MMFNVSTQTSTVIQYHSAPFFWERCSLICFLPVLARLDPRRIWSNTNCNKQDSRWGCCMKRNGMHEMYAGRTNHLIRSRSLKRHLVLCMTHVTEWFMSAMHSLNMSEYFNHAQSTIGQYQGSQPLKCFCPFLHCLPYYQCSRQVKPALQDERMKIAWTNLEGFLIQLC